MCWHRSRHNAPLTADSRTAPSHQPLICDAGAPGSVGRARRGLLQGSAATPASAPASMQAGGGGGATPVAWRGFGSPQPVVDSSTVNGGNGVSSRTRRGMQLQVTTIAGGQLGGLTPRPGPNSGPFGSGAAHSSGSAAAAASPKAFGSKSRGANHPLLSSCLCSFAHRKATEHINWTYTWRRHMGAL